MIDCRCPDCLTTHHLADSLAGKRFRCPSCLVPFRVPQPEKADAPMTYRQWHQATGLRIAVWALVALFALFVGMLVYSAQNTVRIMERMQKSHR